MTGNPTDLMKGTPIKVQEAAGTFGDEHWEPSGSQATDQGCSKPTRELHYPEVVMCVLCDSFGHPRFPWHEALQKQWPR